MRVFNRPITESRYSLSLSPPKVSYNIENIFLFKAKHFTWPLLQLFLWYFENLLRISRPHTIGKLLRFAYEIRKFFREMVCTKKKDYFANGSEMPSHTIMHVATSTWVTQIVSQIEPRSQRLRCQQTIATNDKLQIQPIKYMFATVTYYW